MIHYKTLSDLHQSNGWPLPEHPLLGLVRCQQECTLGERAFTTDCYIIAFKKLRSGIVRYGRTPYDHSNGSLMFVKPRQVLEMRDLEFEEDGFMIFVHEDYLKGYELSRTIENYGFFEYEANEALHLSPREEQLIWDLRNKIAEEYCNNEDEYSREIIIGHLASILMYAQRFYKRQFLNREPIAGKTVTRFQDALHAYLGKGLLQSQGLPSVGLLASELHVSPRYLSDLLKKETGKTAMDLIHISLIGEAKNLLLGSDQRVGEIAYGLGFENVSYFSRLFKKEVGVKPLEFRKAGMN